MYNKLIPTFPKWLKNKKLFYKFCMDPKDTQEPEKLSKTEMKRRKKLEEKKAKKASKNNTQQ